MAEGDKDQISGDVAAKSTSLSSGLSGSATLAEGDNINLNLTKSLVNVVAGNQTNVYNITGAERGANSTSQGVNYPKLLEVINDNTRQETASGIREDFKNEIPHEPDFEVFPQMKKVNVDAYYKGRFREKNSSNDEIVSGSKRKGFQSQFIEEVGFYRQSVNDRKPITMEEIMESVSKSERLPPDDIVGYTAIVASAGSGKTTLMRRIARKALEIPSAKEKNEAVLFKKTNLFHRIVRRAFGIFSSNKKCERSTSEPKLKRKMIHYVELKNMKAENYTKASKLLFGGLFKSESEENQAFEWLFEHQSEAIIIFDGLDQVKWDFEESSVRAIKTFENANTSTIMYNILSRRILRHVKIIVASREFKVSELPAEARPEEIITLNGLTLQDACKLFTFLLCENGQRLWEKVKIMSPRLLQLASVPVFLILIAVVMSINPDRPPPSTVTELYSRIMLVLQSVENIRNRKEILSIINKLKAMAFEGMKAGRVVFYKADLDHFGVSAVEVQDLMTKVPGNNILSRHLIEGDFTFFFCHQSMQEFLAASFVSEMKHEVFSRFDSQHLHEKRWSVVRRFVTGIVYMKSNSDLHSVSDQAKNQQVLSQSIRSQLQDKTSYEDRYMRMELYTAIYESGDDNLMKYVSVVNASYISLNRDEAHIVGSLAARSQSFDSLYLRNCSIDVELLGIITRCFKDRIQVKEVDLRRNKFSATALRSLLGHRLIESVSGNMYWQVVMLDDGIGDIVLKNGEDVIKISGDWIEGHFNIKDSNLYFKRIHTVGAVAFLGMLFDAEFIEFKEQKQLFTKQDDLLKMSECKLEKMSKILLDCAEEENIDWRLIETSWKNYQLKALDVAVNGHIPVYDYNRILGSRRAISVFGNIHAIFYFTREDELGKTIEACQQKKIEYIRCIFNSGYGASLDEISSLVNTSNMKKLTLIYLKSDDMLKWSELQKAKKMANDLDTELEVLELRRERDAWQLLDSEIWRREIRKRQKVQQG